MMSDDSKSPWNSLQVAKLAVNLLVPLTVAFSGYLINDQIRQAGKSQKELEEAQQLAQTRQVAVGNFSRFIYERRVRSELLYSALLRHAASPIADSRKELIERKRLYDESYVNWNTNHQANLLLIRQVVGTPNYTGFEEIVEFKLAKDMFKPLDLCLTDAYDEALRAQNPRKRLSECNQKLGAGDLIDRARECGYAITSELFVISSLGAERTMGERDQAEQDLNKACTVDVPPNKSS